MNHTRRAALAMLAGGATLLATETAGFTDLGSSREFGVGVAQDSDATLQILGVDPDVSPDESTFIDPHSLRFINQRDRDVELTVSSDEFDVQYIDDGGEPIPTGSVTLAADSSEQIVMSAIDEDEDEVTGTTGIRADGPSFSIEFDRGFTVVRPTETNQLNLYFNADTANTIFGPSGNVANNNNRVQRWQRREESFESIDLYQESSGNRPALRAASFGTPARPGIEFTGTRRLVTRNQNGATLGTNLRRETPKQAAVFLVCHPRSAATTGDDRELFRLHQNEDNTIRYRRNPGTVTAVFEGVERTITSLETPANSTHLLALRLWPDGDDLLFEARRNGSQIGSTQNFGDVSIPDDAVVRLGSPNNAGTFDTLFAALRIYHTDQGDAIEEIEETMMEGWGVN
ncbi:hypothetical protein ACLI4Z_03860 [Natrialbaceae archaeon A-arb3/5]